VGCVNSPNNGGSQSKEKDFHVQTTDSSKYRSSYQTSPRSHRNMQLSHGCDNGLTWRLESTHSAVVCARKTPGWFWRVKKNLSPSTDPLL
jgi:hypothetical protein